ncbi:MAG: hypothetical protein GKR89_05965 [Candidatus Latescibacteria bacterium]|nr:hypothetical protein [Candidatus Latescibacterota bacterium]
MSAPTSTTSPPQATLSWTAHPLQDEPPSKTALLCLIIAAVAYGVSWLYQAPLWGLFAGVVLIAAMSRYFLPTRYRIDERGVEITHLQTRLHPWSNFRRAAIDRHGIFLSPFARRHRLDSFRGVHLRLGPQPEQAIQLVREHVATESS